MLTKAQKRIRQNNWKNIQLIQADLTDLSPEFLLQHNLKSNFDIVLAELAFSVVPNWQMVIKNSVNLLKPQGKIGVLDWYRPKNDLLTKTIDVLAKTQTNRNVILYIQKLLKNFKIEKTYFFKSIYIGIGQKN